MSKTNEIITRQQAIKDLITRFSVENQEMLVSLLKKEHNIETNQSIVSRDLRELKVSKRQVKNALIYETIESGKGTDSLTAHDTVCASFTILDTEGNVIVSSQEIEGSPSNIFAIDDLLPSLSRAMVGMVAGEKRIIYVHPNLAYGKFGHLPPNSLLIMEVKLIEIVQSENRK